MPPLVLPSFYFKRASHPLKECNQIVITSLIVDRLNPFEPVDFAGRYSYRDVSFLVLQSNDHKPYISFSTHS